MLNSVPPKCEATALRIRPWWKETHFAFNGLPMMGTFVKCQK